MHPDAQEIIDALEDNRDWWLKQIPDSPNLVDKTKDNFMSEEVEDVAEVDKPPTESAGSDSQSMSQSANDARDREIFVSSRNPFKSSRGRIQRGKKPLEKPPENPPETQF